MDNGPELGATGLERPADSTGKTPSSEMGAAKSAAFSAVFAAGDAPSDPGLATIIDRWPMLPADAKAAILAMIDAADERA